MPNGAAGYYLLGRIHSLTNRHDTAVHFHASALALDPLLWAAYEELCALGTPRHLSLNPKPYRPSTPLRSPWTRCCGPPTRSFARWVRPTPPQRRPLAVGALLWWP